MKPCFELECQSQHFTLSESLIQTFGGHFQTIEPSPRLETLETLLYPNRGVIAIERLDIERTIPVTPLTRMLALIADHEQVALGLSNRVERSLDATRVGSVHGIDDRRVDDRQRI